jgi:NAD(P) transhydrogenase subunit beta
MNILLDEAKVAAAQLCEWQAANPSWPTPTSRWWWGPTTSSTPRRSDDPPARFSACPSSMSEKARTVFVIKRSLRPGAAGVKNRFSNEANTTLVFGDAKKVLQAIGVELKAQAKAAA